jgi:PAS domain S-box-containing protein
VPRDIDLHGAVPSSPKKVLALFFGVILMANAGPLKGASNAESSQLSVHPQLITVPVIAGTDLRFARLATTDELLQTSGYQIVQDNQGFLWFGTRYGLYRYDGYNVKFFTHEPGNPNSLSGVEINTIFKDRRGTFWIGCAQFLNKLDPATEIFTRYRLASVVHISQDSTGALWFGTINTGLYRLDPITGQMRHYAHDPADAASLGGNHITYSGEDREGRFWVASTASLDQFDRGTGKVTRHIRLREAPHDVKFYEDQLGTFWIFHTSPNALSAFDQKSNTITHYAFAHLPVGIDVKRISAMLEDRNGTLWIATQGAGLLKFDRTHQRFIAYRSDPRNPSGLPQDDVDALFEDREGGIWVGLGRMGVVRTSTNPLPFKKLPYAGDARMEPFVGALYEDRQGILWIGTTESLIRVDRNSEQLASYPSGARQPNIDAISLREDRSGNLWAGTYGHGLLRFDRQTGQFKSYKHDPGDPTSLSDDFVQRLLVDHTGTLWAGSQDALNRFDANTGRFTRFKLGPQDSKPYYLEIVENREGTLWLGTEFAGLRRFDPASGKLTLYEHAIDVPGALSDDRVNSILFDRTGTMWVGTQNGLDKFDTRTGKFTVYTKRDGLPGNAIGCLLDDDRGKLWMSTDNGIARFDPTSLNVDSYTTADGLPGPNLTGWGACFKSVSSEEMFFGGFSGAAAFFPDQVIGNSYTPPIVLTDFRLFGNPVQIGHGSALRKPISYTTQLTLSHKQNIFSIGFAALSYANPSTNRYRYRLEELESTWNEVGSDRRQATYTTLPAGEYVLRVQGGTSHGPWTVPGVELHIKILPPWWGATWFRVCATVAAVALFGGLYLWRLRQISARIRRQLEERKRAEEALRANERQLNLIVETIPGLVWCASPDGELTYLNQRILDYIGVPASDLTRGGWANFVHPEDKQLAVSAWSHAVETGHHFEVQHRLRRADGVYRWVHVLSQLGRDQNGYPTRWYGLFLDIDDRKNIEEALRSTQARLSRATQTATLGELSASIAHEINQPLAAVVASANACLRFLSMHPPDLAKAHEAAESIVRDGRDAGEIVRRIRALFKRAAAEKMMLNLNDVIGEVLRLLAGEAAKRKVAVETDLNRNLPLVAGDRIQLQQVVLNLIVNAFEAMEPVHDRSRKLIIRSKQESADAILVEVRDNGVGFDNSERMFEAFVTTKQNGMGMGLTICRSIVEAHNGRLWAASANGRGAMFSFSLPLGPNIES